jgi:hypothetical protein
VGGAGPAPGHDAGGHLSFGAPSYRGGAPNDLIVLAACPRTTISLALRLGAEAVVVTGVSVGLARVRRGEEPGMADCDWLTLEVRIVALLDRRVEIVHVDVNDLTNPPFVHLLRPSA